MVRSLLRKLVKTTVVGAATALVVTWFRGREPEIVEHRTPGGAQWAPLEPLPTLVWAEPDPAGLISEQFTKETWHTIRFRWRFDQCPPDDDTCGWQSYSLAALVELDPNLLVGSFSGKVENLTELTIDPHPLNLRYGALLNFVLEKVVLPLISPAECPIDTYEDFIANLVGGNCCFKEAGGAATCCENFGDSIGNTVGSIAETGCNALIPLASGFLRSTLNDLDSTFGDSLQISTKEPCKMFTGTGAESFTITELGRPATPCFWHIDIGSSVSVDAEFYGVRGQ